jgi:hypothetical protein
LKIFSPSEWFNGCPDGGDILPIFNGDTFRIFGDNLGSGKFVRNELKRTDW